jgi:hypothetical protein
MIKYIFENIKEDRYVDGFDVVQKVKNLISMEKLRLVYLIKSKFKNLLLFIDSWISCL